ncbi:MAG: tRNA epoxyqueuosine(34) reductase QueG, partial [Deltaproteobacteria bacterium]
VRCNPDMTDHRFPVMTSAAPVADPPPGLGAALKTEARRLGFELVGIAPAVTPAGIHDFVEWLDRGYAGQMEYLERREEAYAHPKHVLDGARSVVMLGINYNTRPPARREDDRREEAGSARGRGAGDDHSTPAVPARIARYALGSADYHDVIREKLRDLAQFLRREAPGAKARGVVDTAPLLERDFAQLAGLGWFGKNTMLINRRLGSWFFLAALLVDIALEYDDPHAASHCGTCTRCLEACPTKAFVEPYVLDARRCIAYLTIEHRGPIPEELHAGMGDWLFGCDICQEVCPWNTKAPVTSEPALQPQPDLQTVDAAELLTLTEEEFRRRFGATALARPGREGLVRNATIVAANAASPPVR